MKTNEQYVAALGNRCPHCDSRDIISMGSHDFDEGHAENAIECEDCGSSWVGIYTLTGFTNFEERAAPTKPLPLPMTLEQTIEAMKAEVVSLVKFGTIPATVATFSDLHTYVDANCLAGICVDEVFDELVERFGGREPDDGMPQGLVDYLNQAQGVVDAWLADGGLLLAVSDFDFEGEGARE